MDIDKIEDAMVTLVINGKTYQLENGGDKPEPNATPDEKRKFRVELVKTMLRANPFILISPVISPNGQGNKIS